MSHAAALERAGIPAARRDAVLRTVDRYLKVYKDGLEQPKATNEKLDQVIAAANKLRGHIDALPDVMRLSLGQLAEILAGEEQPLDKFVARAQQLKRIGAKRGRPRGTTNGGESVALDGLLFDLVMLWHREMPGVAGIKREHPPTRYLKTEPGEVGETAEESAARTDGPLLDLAESLLSSEEIEFTSRAALGHRLHRLVAEVGTITEAASFVL